MRGLRGGGVFLIACISLQAQPREELVGSPVERLHWILRHEQEGLFWQAEQRARALEAFSLVVQERAQLERVRSLVLQGDWQVARRELRAWLAREPLSPLRIWFWQWAGVAAFALGDYGEAERCWDSTLSLLPAIEERKVRHAVGQEVAYWYLLALLQRTQYLRADTVAALYLEHYPSSSHADEALLFRALLAEISHEYQRAVQLLETLRSSYPCHTATPLAIAREAYLRLRLQEFGFALRLTEELQMLLERFQQRDMEPPCEKLTVADLPWQELFFMRAEAYLWRQQWQAAQQEYGRLLENFPQGRLAERARLQIAWLALRTGKVAEATQGFLALQQSSDRLVAALAYLYGALALKAHGDTAAAQQKLLELTLQPDFPLVAMAHLELGRIAYEKGSYTAARSAFEQAVREASEAAVMLQALLLLGSTYQQLQRWEEALGTFRTAEQLLHQPSTAIIPQRRRYEEYGLLGMATSLYFLYRPGEALRLLERLAGERLAEALQPDEILFWLAEAQYSTGDLARAVQAYERLLLNYPRSSRREEALYGTAWCAFRLQQMERAVFWFERLLAEFPDTRYAAEASVRKADALYVLGQYQRAAHTYWELAQRFPATAEGEYAAYQYGYVLYRLRDYERAEDAFQYFVRTYPRSSLVEEALYFLGWLPFQQQHYEGAITRFRALLELYPRSELAPRTWFALGNAYYNMERWEEALRAYRTVVEQFPKSPFALEAIKSVQYCLMALGRVDEAYRWIDTVVQQYPATRLEEEARLKRAELFFVRQRYDTALREYVEFAQRYPYSERTAEALYWAVRSALALGDLATAARLSSDLRRRYPQDWYTAQSLLELAREQVRIDPAAADTLYRYIERRGDSTQAAEALFQRGIIAVLRGDTASALERWSAVVGQYPGTEFALQARYRLAVYWRLQERYDSVRALLQPLGMRRDDVGAEALYYIGEAWMREGRCDSAVIAFETLYHTHPNTEPWTPLSLLQVGECYERLGNLAAAAAAYRMVLTLRPHDEYGRTARGRLRRLPGGQP